MSDTPTNKPVISPQLMNYLLDMVEANGLPDFVPEKIPQVDCFADSAQGEGEEQVLYAKLGLDKKASKPVAAEKSGTEVILAKDPTKIYEKLVADGHATKPVESEAELLHILDEVATSAQTTVSPSAVLNKAIAPVPLTPPLLQEMLLAPQETPDSEDGEKKNSSQQGEDDEAQDEPTDETQNVETTRTLMARANYRKMNTFV